jgi:hypothetical protein
MDHFREIKNTLTWHKEGKFEVVLVNSIITKLNFCEPGRGLQDSGKFINSTDYKFLKNVYACLGELFTFIDVENKRLGYKYSREEELPVYTPAEQVTEEYSIPAETRLRILNGANSDMPAQQSIELTA